MIEAISLTNQNANLYVNGLNVIPVGSIICFAGISSPNGWLLCDGSEINRSTYSTLFSIIGTTYGSTSSNTFKLPNLNQKFPMGKTGSNNLGDIGGSTSVTLTTNNLPPHNHTGTTNADGIHSHTGTTSNDGSHTHSISDPGHSHSQYTINDDFNNSGGNPPSFTGDSSGFKTWNNIFSNTTGITILDNGSHGHSLNINDSTSHTHTFTTDSTGLGSSINITNPYIVLNYIIRY
jgi:microcystin-dependent protein